MIQELSKELFTVLAAAKGFILFTRPTSARLYFRDYSLDLLNQVINPASFSDFRLECQQRKFFDNTQESLHRVTHFFYESGFHFHHLPTDSQAPLAIDLCFEKKTFLKELKQKKTEMNLSLVNAPTKNIYDDAYKQGQTALKNGDCYQFNLTYPFDFQVGGAVDVIDFLTKLWVTPQKRGAYAHATYLPSQDQLYFSNSPECLFQVYQSKQDQLLFESMPIKGTFKKEKKTSYKDALNYFQNSLKDQGELNMITDLIRNDLSRIDRPHAFVKKQFDYLEVPGLFHQFSRIQVKTTNSVHVDQVMAAMFPGGSITGAPKKRVLDILKSIEGSPRGFYCGSTLVQSGKVHAASINIRSGVYQSYPQNLRVHAGGGITLKSEMEAEWSEMLSKIRSITQLLASRDVINEQQFGLSDMF